LQVQRELDILPLYVLLPTANNQREKVGKSIRTIAKTLLMSMRTIMKYK